MQAIFESKWAALASVVVVGAFTVHTVSVASVDKVGYGVVAGCKAPCLGTSYLVYECHHFNPLITAVCNPDICLRSAVTMAECVLGDPGAEELDCETHYDASATRVHQWRHAVAAPLTCVDNGPQDSGIPRATDANPCIFSGGANGKCFQAGCPGAITATLPPRLGRTVCSS